MPSMNINPQVNANSNSQLSNHNIQTEDIFAML